MFSSIKIVPSVAVVGLLFAIGLVLYSFSLTSDKIDYNRDVKPIINKKCISCHGGVKKQGGFSFLFEDEAKAKLKSGAFAIVPFKPNQSEIIKRISSSDEDERMPYKHDALSKAEIKIFTDWIKQGAKWGIHWSYILVKAPQIPSENSSWIQNNIDQYILKNIKAEKLNTSDQAPAQVLARRASMDIIGFQDKGKFSKKFLEEPSDKNYEDLLDALLNSEHYGEKWTSMWLDLARYADTKGYEKDDNRSIWRYKNWLINAFNADMPYNQFITEQLAGDLLPHPTDDQYLATAFHRNTMTNDEGGTDNEEFRTAAVIDRVNTTWETLMGTTFSCVQCHAHPYDPIKHNEYYKFLAFFNNTRDVDTPEEYPWLRNFKPELKQKLDSLSNYLSTKTSPSEVESIIRFIKSYAPSYFSMECDSMENSALVDTKWLAMRTPSSARMPNLGFNNHPKMILNYRAYSKSGTVHFRLDHKNGPEIATLTWKEPTKGWTKKEMDIIPTLGRHSLYLLFESNTITNPNQTGVMIDWIHFTNPFPGENTKESIKYKNDFWTLLNAPAEYTPVMFENPEYMARTTQVFERGNWLVKADTVTANTPAIFAPMNGDQPKNRLGLASWITAPDHPLTARVMVNRIWEQLWGTGLVETLEDFGSQGAPPQNQDLLDYLAYSFVNNHKWSIKSLLKEIMMSAAYRQDSKLSPESKSKDLFNKFYARGPRVRLSAEQLRDQALAACDLIDSLYEGSPVMPYQPDGVWQSPYNGKKWRKSEGKNQYRRAIYTFWKRTSAFPSMTNFDATGREVCLSRRIRTNTPLQALTLLNDSTFLDMAGVMSSKYKSENPETAIASIYKNIAAKEIDDHRLHILRKLYYDSMKSYLLKEGNIPAAKTHSLHLVTSAILNLDEVITKS